MSDVPADVVGEVRSTPSISVVMPVYNGGRYLAAALASVNEQTLPPIELIIIDDGSADDSVSIVTDLALPYPVKVLAQENRGQSAARNAGVAHASGEYIAFLDQDDVWYPTHLAALSRAIQQDPLTGWAYSDFDEIDGQGRTVTRQFIHENKLQHPKRSLAACLSGNLMVLPSASLLRTSAYLEVGGFDEALSGYEDDDLFVRMFRGGWSHRYVPTALTRFRVHPTSASASRRFLRSRMRYLGKLRETVEDDARLNRYWVRDLVVPRFFQETLDDYSRAVSARDWDYANEAAEAARQMAAYLPRRWQRRVEMRLMARPRLCRSILRGAEVLPGGLRRLINPALRLRADIDHHH